MSGGAFAGERAVVVGLGSSGRAAARVLAEEGALVRVTEERSAEALGDVGELTSLDVEIRAGGHAPDHLDGATIVVASPGVRERASVLEWAMERGLPIWSELELGSRLCSVPFVAVTGTNGKTTTTTMIAAAMRSAGFDAVACGNIGHPFSLAAREGHQALAVEASSFQLRFHQTFHPRVSVLLNVAPDHLDWHGSFDAYTRAKTRIFECQAGGDVHVGNLDDPVAAAASREAACQLVWFGLSAPGTGEVGYRDGELVALLGEELRLGKPATTHRGFRADAAAAAAAALAFGLDPAAVGTALAGSSPLPHRGEPVATASGVAFVDDSKATNPHAALASLDGVVDAVLIAGGLAKGVDLAPLAEATPRLAAVVAIGEAASEVVAVFESRIPVRKAGSIEEAVRVAFELASPGGTVLLAPACASQDMFRDYAERGDRFVAAARALAEEVDAR